MLQPRISLNGGLAAVTIVEQDLFPSCNVAGGNEDEVRHAINVMQFGLAIPIPTMIDQPSEAISFSSGIHAVGFAPILKIVHVAACAYRVVVHTELPESQHQ